MTVVPVSAFVLNTPMVAMLTPVVVDWCRKHGVSPSRLLIPLSYLTILGGVCTLIGTSTTLVINDILSKTAQVSELGFFDISWVGVPCALVGTLYMVSVARRLLPDRLELVEQLGEQRREYLVEMLVQSGCRLVGHSVESAGLRHLPGLFLIEIERSGDLITPVTPEDVIRAGDRLVFTGVVTTIADLEKIQGLVPAADMTYELNPKQRRQRRLTEAVLSRTSPLIGKTVREADFRKRYNAAIVAVHRNGIRLTNKIGSISLEPGDTLLLQTSSAFVDAYRHSRDFYLVSSVGEQAPRRHDKALVAAALFAILIVWLVASSWIDETGVLSVFKSRAVAAIAIAGLMIVTRCLSTYEARSALDMQVLITIAAALGLGRALDASGAATSIATQMVNATKNVGIPPDWMPYVLLAVVYVLAMIFTEMITNIAVAVMLIPVAIAVATAGNYDPQPFIIAITLAASLSFVTPIGYQTNLMVMGPGGYQPRDYLKVGTPVALLMMITALVLIPLVWAF
jgi:di/tricarboxylate transporter